MTTKCWIGVGLLLAGLGGVVFACALVLWPRPDASTPNWAGPDASLPQPPNAAPADPRLAGLSPYRNVHPSVQYVGDAVCAKCHSKIAEDFRQHSMGRSLFPIAEAPAIEDFSPKAHNPFEALGFRCQIDLDPPLPPLASGGPRAGGRMVHRVTRADSAGQIIASADVEVQFALGSGTRGRSYLVERDGYLFQSPLSWFAQARRWDLSPGYNREPPHFERPITADCLFCHANRVEPVAQSVNRYAQPVFRGHAIGCERCHGPGELHVKAEQQGEGEELTIVNPKRLAPHLRESVCQQCHLHGAARVLAQGRDVFDYRPSLPLHLFWSIFVQPDNQAETYRAVGHVEQMQASRCFVGSQGKLGCTSCHDPHRMPQEPEKVAFYRQRCLQCHESLSCSEPLARRRETSPDDSCIACHMTRFQASDIVHTAITDHRVLRRVEAATDRQRTGFAPHGGERAARLVHFHREFVTERDRPRISRDLGVAMSASLPALVEARAGTPDGQQQGLAALRLLEPALTQWPDDLEALECKGSALWLSGRTQEAAASYDRVLEKAPRREFTLDCAGTLAGQTHRYVAAVGYWERAVKENPHRWRYRYMLAFAHAQQYAWRSALYECQRALDLHPASLETRFLLIRCHLGLSETTQARAEFERFLEFQPPNRDGLRQWFDQETRKSISGR